MSEPWNDDHLRAAYEHAVQARDLKPDEIKNDNQLARVVIRFASNPPQNADRRWAVALREAKDRMKAAWAREKGRLDGDEKLSALSVLGSVTIAVVAREWHDAGADGRAAAAERLRTELDVDGLAPLRECGTLLKTHALRLAYGFDLNFEIARVQAQRAVMLRGHDAAAAHAAFGEVQVSLRNAKSAAKNYQQVSALGELEKDLSFSKLSVEEKESLAILLRGTGP